MSAVLPANTSGSVLEIHIFWVSYHLSLTETIDSTFRLKREANLSPGSAISPAPLVETAEPQTSYARMVQY